MPTEQNKGDDGEISGHSSFITEPKSSQNVSFPSMSEWSYMDFQASSSMSSLKNYPINQEGNPENSIDDVETVSIHSFDSMASVQSEQVI